MEMRAVEVTGEAECERRLPGNDIIVGNVSQVRFKLVCVLCLLVTRERGCGLVLWLGLVPILQHSTRKWPVPMIRRQLVNVVKRELLEGPIVL